MAMLRGDCCDHAHAVLCFASVSASVSVSVSVPVPVSSFVFLCPVLYMVNDYYDNIYVPEAHPPVPLQDYLMFFLIPNACW